MIFEAKADFARAGLEIKSLRGGERMRRLMLIQQVLTVKNKNVPKEGQR